MTIDAEDLPRYPPAIEAAVYFCVRGALQNAQEHSGARRAVITLAREPEGLAFSIRDDGIGFDVFKDLPGVQSGIESLHPDVVVTDIRMPPGGGDEGLRLAAQLRLHRPRSAGFSSRSPKARATPLQLARCSCPNEPSRSTSA